MSPPKDPDRGSETFVRCPIEGCDVVKTAKEMDRHILQSVGDGHGERGGVPEDFSLDDLEEVEAPKNESDCPAKREVGTVARLCPYCEQPFTEKRGVLNHLEQVAGQRDHPSNAFQIHEPGDFPVVELGDDGSVVGVVSSQLTTFRGTLPDEQELEEAPAFATFSKEQVDYLSKIIYSQTDERARLILERPYVESL